MQKTIYDSYLGAIEYSEAYDSYKGKIKNKNGEIIEFSFDVNNNFEEVLEVTRQIIEQLESSSRKLKVYAADKLLNSYNNIRISGYGQMLIK